jgi:hypothetical protein
MGWGSESWADSRARRERRLAAAIVSTVSGIAAVGVLLVALCLGSIFYFFDRYWPAVIWAALLVIGAGRLLWRKRWEGVATGACCWLLVCLELWGPSGSAVYASALIAYGLFLSSFAIALAANTWALLIWLWDLRLRRSQVVGILCALSLGVLLTARPYWVAKYLGREANLRHAMLLMACLGGADLRSADLSGANLTGAWLEGANLTGADLRGAKLAGALYDGHTKWPDGFDPQARGARMAWGERDDGE